MLPEAEFVHWWFATGFLIIGLLLFAEALVGEAVWRRRPWRVYLWPSFLFLMGVLMWPVMVFYTNSTIHMLAHGSWAQAMMLAGAAELGLARGKLRSPCSSSLRSSSPPTVTSRRSSATCPRSPEPLTDDFREKCCAFSAGLACPFASLGSTCGDCCGARLPGVGLRAREPRRNGAELQAAAPD